MATWAYRRGSDGAVESEVFEEIPKGWVDTPAKLEEAPKKRGRKPKSDDNSE